MASNGSTAQGNDTFSTFDPVNVTDQIRAMSEKSIEQSRQAYATVKENIETVQKALEQSVESARATGNELSLRAISTLRDQTAAGFDHLEALSKASTPSQFLELQAAFIRRQSEVSLEQLREVQAAAVKVTEDAFKPFRNLQARHTGNASAT